MKKVLMFDMDGVIIDSWPIISDIVGTPLEKWGYTYLTKKDLAKLWENNLYESLKELGLTPEQIEEFMAFVWNKKKSVMNTFSIFPGIRKVLERLSRHELFVVTSGNTELALGYLRKHNLAFFNDVLGGDVEKSKVKKIKSIKEKYPDAGHFFIGDTKGDMIEGKKAGVATIGVLWGWHTRKTLEEGKPDHIVKTPEDLLALFSS